MAVAARYREQVAYGLPVLVVAGGETDTVASCSNGAARVTCTASFGPASAPQHEFRTAPTSLIILTEHA